MDLRIAGQCLVIGGSSGIGLAVAELCRQSGATVHIASRRRPESRPESPSSFSHVALDVTDEDSVSNAARSMFADGSGKLDGLVYCAGVASPATPITSFDRATWEGVLSTNVTGALLVLKHFYPMLRAAAGRVVVVNSVAARIASRLSGVEYTVSKAALSGLVRHLAIQWAPDGVLINSVFPAMTRTPMLEAAVSPATIERLEANLPLGRIAVPNEPAAAIVFLLSTANTYITGSGIDVAGGLYLNG